MEQNTKKLIVGWNLRAKRPSADGIFKRKNSNISKVNAKVSKIILSPKQKKEELS